MSKTDYVLKYWSRAGREYETAITSCNRGARLRREAEQIARDEILDRYPKDRLDRLIIKYAGPGDDARRRQP